MSKTRPMQACAVQKGTCTFACIRLPATSVKQVYKRRSFRLPCCDIDNPLPRTHICSKLTDRRGGHARKSSSPCFSQSLFTLTFFLTFPHTYIYSHTHTHSRTQSTHSISRTPSAFTQRETTWTKRSGFTLLEELEPLGVETEENYNI